MSILTNPMVYGAVAIVVIILALLACLFAPIKLMINAARGNTFGDDRNEIDADYSIDARWPSPDSLSREYGKEFEPRGM